MASSCATIEARVDIGTPPQIAAVTPDTLNEDWAVSWWMPRHEEKLAEVAKGKIDLVMIGDSITHGWENAGRQVWNKYYKKRKPLNLGYSGDRTENVLWRLQHGEVEGISPKLAVIMIGTNNTGHRQEAPEHTALGIRYIIDELQHRLPKTKILLLAIFPREESPNGKLRKINDDINDIISGYAKIRNVSYLDINHVFLDPDGTLPKSIMPDLLHPQAKGYALWAEAMEPAITRLMGEKKHKGKHKGEGKGQAKGKHKGKYKNKNK
jgi:beta-glucosidase